ncbi:shikimate kinase [Phormidesmis priestleyi ULC007]|uniref:Shikimate kinase n=2 Tax=Phormidesmis priestleyi TaxID=268141 RepID=A0A2T1DF25_9CYAN|nr:shikimate kinase [Phormidesmis priestleyi ULC007]PZO54032.1 MAG: shikimate kinase [Phormidesmis priestleyi]
MMGAGKTTIGRLLAQHLSYRFFDTDAVIEQAATQTITQIFAESGEAAFRQLETQVLAQLSPYTQLVIATGGGIVLKRENWSYLRHGVVVWLDVPIEQLHQRLQQDTSRPILQDQKANLKEKLQALSDQRQSLYAQADLRITVMPDESATQVAARVMDAIAQKCQEKSQINERLRLMNQETPYQIEP